MSLTRPRNGMIGGVCAGLADYFKIDATLVRIIFAVVTLFSAGTGILVYLALWAVIPREEGGSLAEEGLGKAKKWYDDRKSDPQDPQGPRYDI